MSDRKVICLLVFSLVKSNLAIDYRALLLNETITHYQNEYLSFSVHGTGDEMHPRLFVHRPITPTDDLQLLMEAWRSDGLQFPFPYDPISLCYLLEHDADSDNIMANFRASRIFGLRRRHCPINHGEFRLSPYTPPHSFSMEKDLGCDTFRFRASLMKCDFVNTYMEQCLVIIKAEMQISILADYCSLMTKEANKTTNIQRAMHRLSKKLFIHTEI